MEDKDKLKQLVADSNNITVFTGAGISTESGIPDYRGPEGVWTKGKDLSVLRDTVANAEPNVGHLAVTRLWEQGKLRGVVTQNVDRLHQAAGVPDKRVHELHGSGNNIVNFGDMLDETTWFKASAAVLDCDLLLVLGSSLQVYPAAGLVATAQDDGIKNVIINYEPTPYDSGALFTMKRSIGSVMGYAVGT
jgi:NAD-dependent deacetylase